MAVRDFKDMPAVMTRYAKTLGGVVEQTVRTITQAGLDAVLDAMPADTTKAISNTVVTFEAPSIKERPPRVSGSVKGSGAVTARNIMKSEGANRIKYFTLGSNMFISNPLPYIDVLEHGDSKHVANNMFARGVQKMSLTAKKIRILKTVEEKV